MVRVRQMSHLIEIRQFQQARAWYAQHCAAGRRAIASIAPGCNLAVPEARVFSRGPPAFHHDEDTHGAQVSLNPLDESNAVVCEKSSDYTPVRILVAAWGSWDRAIASVSIFILGTKRGFSEERYWQGVIRKRALPFICIAKNTNLLTILFLETKLRRDGHLQLAQLCPFSAASQHFCAAIGEAH